LEDVHFEPPNKNKAKTLTEKLVGLEMKSPEEETCLDTTEKYKLDAVSDK